MASTNQHVILTDANGNVVVPASPTGQQISGNSTSVVIASDQSPVPVTLAAEGSVKIGTIDIDQSIPGTSNGVVVNSSALPAGAAQDGTDGTGITAPTGGAGMRGWLSGIYARLSGSLTIAQASAANLLATVTQGAAATAANAWPVKTTDGTNIAAVKAASSAAAATDPALVVALSPNSPLGAGANIVGSVLGRTSAPSVTPTLTAASAYTAGNVVGGLLTFASAVDAALSGILQRVTINCKSVQTAGFKLYVFAANPSSSTFTDKTAPAIAAADVGKLVDVIALASPDSGLGTHTLYVADGLADAFVLAAASLYAVLVTTATPTFGSTSDISVSLGILKD